MKHFFLKLIILSGLIIPINGCQTFNLQTQKSEEVKLFPIIQNSQVGYMNKYGKVIIPPKFDSGYGFSDGLAITADLDETGTLKFGFIDETGNIVIKPQFYDAEKFSDGLAKVWFSEGKIGFIDKTGKIVIEPEYFGLSYQPDRKLNFNEGLAPVMVQEGGTYVWGFVDKIGKMIIEPQFSYASDFSEGLAVVVIRDKINRWNESVVFINKAGKIVIQAQFFNAKKFQEGLAAVKLKVPEDPSEKGSRWITIDKTGQSFVEKWGFIDKTGKIVIPPQFVEVESFSEGLAKVAVINNEGKQVWGFIDRTGKMVINPQFADVTNFKNGLAAVSYWTTTKSTLTGSVYHHKSNFGFIDKTGKEVIPPKFSEVCPKIVSDFCLTFNNDLAFVVVDDHQMGYINKKGEFIWSSSNKK